MSRPSSIYIKPWYKIVLRYSDELRKYIFAGRPISQALGAFQIYFQYNRQIKSHYEEKLPWITHYAYERLKGLVKPDMRVLEFGMGGSTLFFRNLGAEVYSFEHDEQWFNNVKGELEADDKVHLNLIKPEVNDPTIDSNYSSEHGLFSEGLTWKAYAHGADHFDKEFFDIILIDGRARPQCLRNSISKLKKGGILVFDNSDRDSYQEAIEEVLGGWSKEVYSGVTIYDWAFNETSIFFHPEYLK
ncbi:hypothetical protein [Algoriphagus sediminis]|uniref:Class I SAM-dependent methyltransferase n=1 Tax=Algoriphagus sediminis TaxID=3057113 RepID=A0ABT7YEU7_9BACT|nr:hypothetical protein [Algoriphagus sediminis]MDN3204719.1 hypothetical protein [Algoriphagus sediminis]